MQFTQFNTLAATLVLLPGLKNFSLNFRCAAFTPKCPALGWQCIHLNIFLKNASGTHTLSLSSVGFLPSLYPSDNNSQNRILLLFTGWVSLQPALRGCRPPARTHPRPHLIALLLLSPLHESAYLPFRTKHLHSDFLPQAGEPQ